MKKLLLLVPIILALLAFPLTGVGQQAPSGPGAGEVKGGDPHQHLGPHHGGGASGSEHGAGSPGHHGGMMDQCKQMMAKHDQASADLKAMDDRLDEKVAAMNAAKGDERFSAMAAVVNELVAQRKEMREKMGEMHHGKMCMMMCPMMGEGGHHKMGGGGMGGMHDCPMMQKQGG